ncbi:MAG: TldD/PmbA family protein [Rhodothalassiaceae bacterium]
MNKTDTVLDREGAEAVLDLLIAGARKAGATDADALAIRSEAVSASVRLGALEDIERAESTAIGLRVFVGHRQATLSSSDLDKESLSALACRAVEMAKVAPEDPHAGLADPARLGIAPDADRLDLADGTALLEDDLRRLALAAEDSARAVPGVTNSGGAGAGRTRHRLSLRSSNGFAGSYESTNFSLSVTVLAGASDAMERDYAYSTARHYGDLQPPEALGREAGERAVRRVGARRIATGKMPVLFEPRVANSLVGHFAQAVNGIAIARGTSFLAAFRGKAVFAPGIAIWDDPTRRRGLKSRPFDAEGVMSAPLALVEDGILENWLLDSASARRLGLETTGSATRGLASPPAPASSNLWIAAGEASPESMIADIGRGLYVTELIGMGVNPVTGDYSRGASGYLIENGRLGAPVSEVTVAGNLIDMFRTLIPASDLEFRYGTNAPTLLVPDMMVAGD